MTTAPAPVDDDPVLFEARLTPYRSLTPRAFLAVMGLIGTISFISGLIFWLRGAWPVAGFCGLDVLVMWWAFRANFAEARAYEDIRVTAHELSVVKVDRHGHRAEWRDNPVWARLDQTREEDEGVIRLAVRARGTVIPIATFLGAAERTALADALADALRAARAGITYRSKPA